MHSIPQGKATCGPTGGANAWLCQHRWTATSGMVGFRNAVGSAPLANWVSPAGDRIAFGRGSSRFVSSDLPPDIWQETNMLKIRQVRWDSSLSTTLTAIGPAPSPPRCPTDRTAMLSRGSWKMVRVLHLRAFFCPSLCVVEFDGTFCRISVTGGSFKATIPARGAIAIHFGSKRP
jgi:hypothetical protein